jgi:hypothetical protein
MVRYADLPGGASMFQASAAWQAPIGSWTNR